MNIAYIKSEMKRHSIVIGALLVIIYFAFFLLPIIDRINRSKHQIETLNNGIHENISSQFIKRNISEGVLLNMENNDEIAYNIKIISDTVKVNLSKISFGDGVNLGSKAGSLYGVPVQLTLTGNLNNLISFVNIIETRKQIYEIVSFDVNDPLQLDQDSKQAQINLRYFYSGG